MKSLLDLFDELCDLNPTAVAQRLQQIQLVDPGLANQLRAMLEADSKVTDLIAHDLEAQAPLGRELRNFSVQPNDFGQYRLVRELGSGGMGVVYLAERELEQSNQKVALKFVKHTHSPDLIKHFSRERDALAKLEHPNIARLIDAGTHPNGLPFIATEYIEGVPLLDYVRQKKLDLAARLQLIENLCAAVDYAHRRLVVHRDIKPSNVMVDHSGHLRLLDFGIAKVLDADDVSRTYSNPLSPAYASPEQALGEAISTATDVFGLGLLLFELLTGQLPAQRRSVNALDMARKIGAETIEPPSVSDLSSIANLDPVITNRDWPKQLRGDLDLIVLKALKREPERRYASASALAEDLRRFREGRAISARPDSTWYRWRKFITRNKIATVASVTMVSSLSIGLSVALWQAREAKLQLARAEQANAQASATRDFIVRRLSGSIDANAQLLMKDWIKAALPALDVELAEVPEAQAELTLAFAQALKELGQFEAAISAVDLGIQRVHGAEFEDAQRKEASALHTRGSAKIALGQLDAGERDLLASLALFDRIPIQSIRVKRGKLATRTALAVLSNARGRTREALQLNLQNLADKLEVLGRESNALAVEHHNIGLVYSLLGQYESATQSLEQSAALLRKLPNEGGARMGLVEGTLGATASNAGNWERAATHFSKASAILNALHGANHFDTLSFQRLPARLALARGNPRQAKALLEPALEPFAQSKSRIAAEIFVWYGQAQLQLKENMPALKSLDRADLLISQHGCTPVRVLPMLRALALARLSVANPGLQQDATMALQRAVFEGEALMINLDVAPLLRAEAASMLAATFRTLKQDQQVEPWQQRAAQSFSEAMPEPQAQQWGAIWDE